MNLLKFQDSDNDDMVLIGFSLGAYSAMYLATILKIDKLILVSPSPLFKGLSEKMPQGARDLHKDEKSFETVKDFCNKIDCDVEVYVGDKELDVMKETALMIANHFGKQLNVVPNMGHEEKLFDYVTSKS